MTYNQFRSDCSRFLDHLAASLDIPASLHEKAKNRYESVGSWLDRDAGPLAGFRPAVYPQGSFRLGTVIKPISDKDDYDIDLVCQLERGKHEQTQEQLKLAVGAELKAYAKANSMNSIPKNNRRCWRLDYADDADFHMDVLPAIPDDQTFGSYLIRAGVPQGLAKHAVAITDDEHQNYRRVSTDWPRSNPKGYAGWFLGRMKVRQDALKRGMVAMEKYAKVDDVPEYEAKTPLQRCVQLLKRHRDIMFAADSEDKPISVIISTLAAHAYDNEADLLDSLITIVDGMPSHVRHVDGQAWVGNPVNPQENFADKWPGAEKGQKFWEWHAQVKADLEQALETHELNGFIDAVETAFGGGMTKAARTQMQKEVKPGISLIKRASAALARFNVTWRQKADWPMAAPTRFRIGAQLSKRSGFRPFTYQYRSGGEKLRKGLTIRFRVECTFDRSVDYYWQITNTGDEARWADDLRGGFKVDGTVHEERTKYTGEHCVQCFVVKNGTCIAKSDEFIVRIQ
jgi:hypothetical protein